MKKNTEKLLELLKNSSSISDYIDQNSSDLLERIPLNEYLSDLLTQKGRKKSDLIRLSGLDRGYAYEIFSGNKIPSREKLLAICFSFPLSLSEVQTLLKVTGYPPLYARIEYDSIILFALDHQLSLTDVNELLYDMNQRLLC